jgi:hypothetical protein
MPRWATTILAIGAATALTLLVITPVEDSAHTAAPEQTLDNPAAEPVIMDGIDPATFAGEVLITTPSGDVLVTVKAGELLKTIAEVRARVAGGTGLASQNGEGDPADSRNSWHFAGDVP